MTQRASYTIEIGLGHYDTRLDESADLLARWKLNEPIGPTFADSAAGTYPADSVTSGDPFLLGVQSPLATDTMGATFSGSQFLNVGVHDALSMVSGGTVAYWIKTTHSGSEITITGKMTSLGAGWRATMLSSGKIRFLMQTNALATIVLQDTTATYNDGAWHRVVHTVVFGVVNQLKTYVDGGLPQTTGTSGTPQLNSDPFLIAAYSASFALKFVGTLFDVVLWSDLRTLTEVQAEYANAQWTDVSPDVMADGIRFQRGVMGNTPIDVVARPGLFYFDLDNSAANSAETLGYYSPDHDDVRDGWEENIPVRLVGTYSATDYPIWRGRVAVIAPTAGEDRDRVVHVIAQGCLGAFLTQKITALSPEIAQGEATLIRRVVQALPEQAWPPGLTLNASGFVIPYAFYQMGRGDNALQILQQIAVSVRGLIFEAADGTLAYRDFSRSGLGVSTHAVDDDILAPPLLVERNFDHLYDRVRCTVHPVTASAADTEVLFQASTIFSVGPGQELIIDVAYVDPDNTKKTVGGIDFQTVTASTDYEAHSNNDGTGTDLTGTVIVAATPYGSLVRFVLTNPHGSLTAYFVSSAGDPFLQVRGRRLSDDGPVAIPSDEVNPFVSFTPAGNQIYDLDLPLIADPDQARTVANFIAANWRGPHVDAMALEPQTDAIELVAALDAEVGDFWDLSESVTGSEQLMVMLNGFEGEIVQQDLLNLTVRLAPWAGLIAVP